MLQSLPSLGATTAVPGAAGLSTNVPGSASGGDLTGGNSQTVQVAAKQSNDFFGDMLKSFGQSLSDASKDASPNEAQTAVSGDEAKEATDNWAKFWALLSDPSALLIGGIALILVLYGLSAATRR
jgi:hypothetical protein